MADLDIDAVLSESLKGAAEPADSAGVADLIRARVAAGDVGLAVTSTTAPGFVPRRPRWFWPLLATVAGLAVALSVLISVVVWPSTPDPTVSAVISPTPSASQTPTPTPSLTPTPTPTPTEPQQPPPPPPARDTTAPTISAGQWSNGGVVYNTGSNWPTCNESADILVTASDDEAVAKVSAVTSMKGTKAEFVGASGADYTFRFTGSGAQTDTQINVTFTATDTAGNTASASRPITLRPCIVIF